VLRAHPISSSLLADDKCADPDAKPGTDNRAE
jgi:hypothetical protein